MITDDESSKRNGRRNIISTNIITRGVITGAVALEALVDLRPIVEEMDVVALEVLVDLLPTAVQMEVGGGGVPAVPCP